MTQTATLIEQAITDNVTGNTSRLQQTINTITTNITAINGQTSMLIQTASSLEAKISDNEVNSSNLWLSVNSIVASVQSLNSSVQQVLDGESWKVVLNEIGAYSDATLPKSQTISLTREGVIVTSGDARKRVIIDGDGLKGQFEGVDVFHLNEKTTKTDRILVDNGIDMSAMKVAPTRVSGVAGIVFVKSGGMS